MSHKTTSPGRRFPVLLKQALKAFVALAVLGWLFRRYDFRTVFQHAAEISPGYLAIAWLFGFLAMFTFSHMQTRVFRPLDCGADTRLLLKIQYQQRFYALFLPGGTAALVKWYKLAKPSGKPGLTLALMAFMRLLNFGSIAVVTAAAILADATFPWPRARWATAAVAALLFLGPLWLLSDAARPLRARLERWVRLPQRLRDRTEALAEYPRAIRSLGTRDLAFVYFLSAASQVCYVLQQAFCAYAVGVHLNLLTFAWLRTVVALCTNLPITVAGLGLREVSLVAFLAYYNIPEAQAIAYSLVFFAAFPFLRGIIGGILELLDIWRGTHAVPPPA